MINSKESKKMVFEAFMLAYGYFFGRREGVMETGNKTSFMFWLLFIGNQPVLSQWNEGGGEQNKSVLREIPVKE